MLESCAIVLAEHPSPPNAAPAPAVDDETVVELNFTPRLCLSGQHVDIQWFKFSDMEYGLFNYPSLQRVH